MRIELEGVTIRYGERIAVSELSTSFPPGTVGLLGRNGAGKSSVLKALLGLVRPSAGRMWLVQDGRRQDFGTTRGRVGYMPERDAHLPAATGFEMVSLLGMLSGMPRRDAWRRAHEVLFLVGLEEQRYRAVAGYSAGMRQKAKLAAALVHDPGLLFLDEPTNGLDPQARADMLALVGRLARELGKSVVLSTHILQDVESVCDHVVVLEAGKVVVAGEVADLTESTGREYQLAVEPSDLELPASPAPGITVRREGPGQFTVGLVASMDTCALFAALRAAGGRVRSLAPRRRTLEQVFVTAVRRELPEARP
ncbi:MAG: ABC transporter ATP-binding protein [Planctomycetes bacterium]|nr:ABC transporter ATP-binding protein [Planctomycetota bacterium]